MRSDPTFRERSETREPENHSEQLKRQDGWTFNLPRRLSASQAATSADEQRH